MLVQLAKRQVKAGSIIATQTAIGLHSPKVFAQFLNHQMGVTQPENSHQIWNGFWGLSTGHLLGRPTHFYKKSHADSLYKL